MTTPRDWPPSRRGGARSRGFDSIRRAPTTAEGEEVRRAAGGRWTSRSGGRRRSQRVWRQLAPRDGS